MNVYYLESSLSYSNTRPDSSALLDRLFSLTGNTCELISPDISTSEKTVFLYVATGGTEGIFRRLFLRLADASRYVILCSGTANSLAASIEILTYLNRAGRRGRIIFISDIGSAAAELDICIKCAAAEKRLCGMKLGQLGMPSDWLIASGVDADALKQRFGAEIENIPLSELLDEYQKKTYSPSALTEDFLKHDFDAGEKENALFLYGAIKRIADNRGLSGITVRCFDLLKPTHTTGCTALALLNAEGIYAGCEGDMAALVSMTAAGVLTGEPCFMCNPSQLDIAQNKMLLAHCTLPLNMPRECSLMTHFESDSGVALRGIIDTGAATLLRISGDMDRFFVTDAEIISVPRLDALCRTQIEIKAEKSLSRLLTDPLGNHQIILKGHHAALLEEFLS